MNWQPIETAPIEREDVLLWTPSGMLVGYCYVRGKWHASGVKASDEGADVELFEAPTHWMPLPAEPGFSRSELQAGMSNAELAAAWERKLPGVAMTDRDLTAFALGAEVGFAHARDLDRQDWSRVHHVLAKHGKHPGRTDDHLADVIDRALADKA